MAKHENRNILLATRNAGKVEELRQMLAAADVQIAGLDAYDQMPDVAETGATFIENARLKAVGYARMTGNHALADDSGLEIDRLGGRPGVLSARYAGEAAPFSEKIEKLLKELEAAPGEGRTARFVCALSFAAPDGRILKEVEGVCRGTIADEARGQGGFGYDPIFVPDGFDRTFGELSAAVKGDISHRARAMRVIIPFLRDFNCI